MQTGEPPCLAVNLSYIGLNILTLSSEHLEGNTPPPTPPTQHTLTLMYTVLSPKSIYDDNLFSRAASVLHSHHFSQLCPPTARQAGRDGPVTRAHGPRVCRAIMHASLPILPPHHTE